MSECVAPAGTKVPFKHGKCQRSSAVAQGLTARPASGSASGCVAEARTLLLPVTKASVVTGTAWDALLPLGTLERLGTNHARCETT